MLRFVALGILSVVAASCGLIETKTTDTIEEADRIRADDRNQARRDRFQDRRRTVLVDVLAGSIRLRELAELRRTIPRAVSDVEILNAYRFVMTSFAEVSLLEPDLRIVVGDLPIAAQQLVDLTTRRGTRWKWPDVETRFDDAVRLYIDVVSKRLAE